MKYIVEVKHNITGRITGFNLLIDLDGLVAIPTDYLIEIKKIMDTDFIGFHITTITLVNE